MAFNALALPFEGAKLSNLPTRIKASTIHLSVSAAIAAIVAAIVFVLWYPGDYRNMSGGTELFILVVSVDVVIGPIVTFFIFDTRKPMHLLKLDLVLIASLQMAAFGYGIYMVSISRPVMLALEEDRFRVVSAHEIYEPELPSALPEFRSLSLTGPRLARSPLPSDPKERSDALLLGLKGHDIGARPSLWKAWNAESRAEALSHAKPLETLKRRYPNRGAELSASIARTGLAFDQVVYIPMITFRNDWVALLDARDGSVVGFAPFDGF